MDVKYMWCLHCERTYIQGESKFGPYSLGGAGISLCPYPGCNGSVYVDGWDWIIFRNSYHPEYPEIPVKDVVYPAYPLIKRS
jgi:hypothetical protein